MRGLFKTLSRCGNSFGFTDYFHPCVHPHPASPVKGEFFALLQDRPGDREGTGCGKRASPLCSGFGAGLVAPFDQREIEGLQRDLDSRDAAGMDAGAAVVIDGLGLVLPADAPRGDAGLQVAPLREREVLEDGAFWGSGL